MDLFTQNMINRTKQRQELLTKLKPNGSVVSSSPASTYADNVKQMTDIRKTGKLLASSEPDQMVVKETTKNDFNSKEKENDCHSKSNKVLAKSASTQPTTIKHAVDDYVDESNSLPAAHLDSRRTRLDALAYRINDWEDESLSNLKQTVLPVREKNLKTLTKDYVEKQISKVTPCKVGDGGISSSGSKEKDSPSARKYVSGHLSTKPSTTTVTQHVTNATASPTKAVVLDKSVLHCLESQGFKPTASRSRLIYEYEKEQEAEVEDEAAKSWTYSAGTPEKRSLGQSDNRSSAALKDSPKNKPIRSPIYITKTDQSKKSPLILNQKSNANQKISNLSKDIKCVTNIASPVKRSVNSGAAQSSSKKEIINSNDVGVSVLKRVAQFDSPRLAARDPAEFSLSERKALFEKNKGKPPTPKFASPDVPRPSLKNASPISTAFNSDQNCGPSKSTKEHSLSAYKNASNAKAERMKELEELRNRHGEKRQLEPTAFGSKTPSKEIAFEFTEETLIDDSSDFPIVKSSSPQKSSSSMPKFQNTKGFRKSPAKDSYAGLDEVKPIRVSPPKPGKLYPCLSDIEMTTENETDSDDSDGIASPSDSSPVANMNTSQDLDSSFTTDILGRAGLSQFINTPKKKLQEMQLNKQALLRSIAEHNLIVSDDDSEEVGEISDLLNEALEQNNSSGESTPPKQLKLDRKSQSVEEDGPSTMLYHSVSSYRKQQQDQTATPVRQVVRNPEVRSQPATTSKFSESQEVPIQQQIRNLQEEINTQQTVMAQASQALNLCRATAEFSGSTEQVEGEKLLLIASQKRQAAMNEIQRLKTEAAMKKPFGGYASRGTLSISGLSLPLKRDFVAMQSKGGDDYIHYFIMLIRHRGQVIPLQMLSTLDGIQDGALRFPNLIQLRDLPADFQVAIEVYALQTKKEKLDHNQKYHIRKDCSKMRLTPKKLVNKQESRLLSKTPLSSPAGPSAVRNSSFGLVGFTTISSTSLRRQEWSLEKVPFASPIDGALQLKIQCHTESLVEERGFLTIFEDVGGFGAWHRRWCLLSNDQLLFWKYPDDEKRKEPLSYINLRKCVTEVVDAVSHDICARPNTFLLVTVREPLHEDKDSLVMTCYPHRTALRHLLSADLKDERQLWCSQLNRAIGNLRAWDMDSQQPSAEGSTPKILG